MKLTRRQLRQLINETINNTVLVETQKKLGLEQTFNNYKLAERINDAIGENAPEDILADLRNIALRRINKLRRDIGQEVDVENKTQELFFLESAINDLDKHRGDFYKGKERFISADHALEPHEFSDDDPDKGYPVTRREQQAFSRTRSDQYRDAATQRALKNAGKPHFRYRFDPRFDK